MQGMLPAASAMAAWELYNATGPAAAQFSHGHSEKGQGGNHKA